jgi:hypothetical protein
VRSECACPPQGVPGCGRLQAAFASLVVASKKQKARRLMAQSLIRLRVMKNAAVT